MKNVVSSSLRRDSGATVRYVYSSAKLRQCVNIGKLDHYGVAIKDAEFFCFSR